MSIFELKHLSGKAKERYTEFAEFLGEAISEGKVLPCADNDINYTIGLQHKRIQKKGLHVDYKLEPSEKDHPEILDVFNRSDSRFDNNVSCREFHLNRRVVKNGQLLYKDRPCCNLYETCTDLRAGSRQEDVDHSCPNCGAVSKLSELLNGCPHCGTSYMIDDLFPKVSGYYLLDWPDSGSMKKNWILCIIICSIVFTLLGMIITPLSCIITGEPLRIGSIIAIPFAGIMGGVLIGGLYFPIFWFIGFTARSISVSAKTSSFDSRRTFERKMKKISPEFSCDYFIGKAVSLIRTAVFSENEQDLLFYNGPALDPGVKDIIDMNYSGAFSLKKFEEKDGLVNASLQFYMHILYAKEDRVYLKKQLVSASFQRRVDIPINYSFSMTRIQCPSCGASFNAILSKHCPYCGREYEIITDDWALTELRC